MSKEQVPEGYKQTEVGMIPEDWSVKPFSSLFQFKNGVNADKSAYGQGVRFINVLEPITYSHLHGSEIQGQVTLPQSLVETYSVKCGDILFNRTSEVQEEVGLAAVYVGTEKVVFGGFVIRGRPIDEYFYPDYSGYALRASCIRSQIIPLGQGAIRANIGQQNLQLVLAPVPPLSEQRAIASTLSDIDNLLASLDRLIAKKRDLKQATMQQLLTGKKRLPGFGDEKDCIRTDIGDFPIDWDVLPLKKLCKINQGLQIAIEERLRQPTSKSKKYITIQAINSGDLIEYIDEYSSSVCCDEDDVLMTRTGNTGIVVTGVAGVFHNNFFKVKFDRDRLDKNFFVDSLRTERMQREILEKAGTSTIPDLNHNDFYSIKIAFPSIKEQKAIAQVLTDMDTELTTLQTRRTKTQALKQAMMQQLLTGKTRLLPSTATND